ncbi:hypothetical protein A3765_28620 [Oleiphilus sp. HI0130]|nr:hypothetical protein A3765_28905 [Oleiphilus sp. HI0130]KZZ72517.1 hypothetical protein A3765_28620 [Oleiphilus sp. HI0130]
MDHICQAIYDVVHDSDLSTKEIASRLGMPRQTLINKANPQCESHKLGVLESVAIQKMTGSTAIVRAMMLELDQSKESASPAHYLQAALHFSREVGDVVRAIEDAAADGRFTAREVEQCMREMDEAEKSISELRASLLAHSGLPRVRSI